MPPPPPPPPPPHTHTHLPPPPPARYPLKLNQQGPVKVTNSWRLYLFNCRVFLSNFPHANFTNAANLDIIVFEKTEMLSPMLPWTGKLITSRKETMIKWGFFHHIWLFDAIKAQVSRKSKLNLWLYSINPSRRSYIYASKLACHSLDSVWSPVRHPRVTGINAIWTLGSKFQRWL